MIIVQYFILWQNRLMALAKTGEIELLMLKNKVAPAFSCDEALHCNSKQNTLCGKVKALVKCLSYSSRQSPSFPETHFLIHSKDTVVYGMNR